VVFTYLGAVVEKFLYAGREAVRGLAILGPEQQMLRRTVGWAIEALEYGVDERKGINYCKTMESLEGCE
jgi:hypothetical protein